MPKFNIEDYREPWETGPHWELKREFMEKYQDDFSEDRLICLAQAYSNIELMDCSYPAPVMRQIHELSKSLHASKRCKEEEIIYDNNGQQLMSQKRKRGAEDSQYKQIKFVKFCSANEESSNKAENSVDATKASLPISSSGPVEIDTQNNNQHLLVSISKSPQFELLERIAEKIQASVSLKERQEFLTHIEKAVEQLDVKHLVNFKYDTTTLYGVLNHICKFYIGNTLIAIGRGQTKKQARIEAGIYSKDIFTNLKNLPNKTLDDLKESIESPDPSLSSEVESFMKMGSKIAKFPDKTAKAGKIMRNLKETVVVFNVRDDHKSPLNQKLYCTDVVVNKVLISEGQDTKKKRAGQLAMVDAVTYLTEFLDSAKKKNTEAQLPEKKETKCNPATLKNGQKTPTDQRKGLSSAKGDVQSSSSSENKTTELSSVDPSSNALNHRKLNNSLTNQFAILDSSKIHPAHTAQSIVSESAAFCRKQYRCDLEAKPEGKANFKCDIYIENNVVGTAEGMVKNEVKSQAYANTLKNLQDDFYTIVIKDEKAEGFIVKHCHVMDAEAASIPLEETNVGHKMLKMMGWTGGGIGKTEEGITEPISAGEHSFKQGLGFNKGDKSNSMRLFKRKILALLRDYSKSSTVGDLIFSTDFSNVERSEIHRLSRSFGLKSVSYGKEPNRQLFVKRKLTVNELLNHLVSVGGSTSKYELVDQSQE